MGDGQLRATLSPRLPEGHDEETGKQKPLYFPLGLGGFLFFWSWTFAPSSQSSQYRLLRVKVTHCQSLPRATQHRL